MTSWYRTGTISVNNGSTTVTGSGTDFISGTAGGEGLLAPDGKVYEIVAVVSGVALTISPAYLGANALAQAYAIIPTQSYIRDLANQAAALVNDYATTNSNAFLLTVADKTPPVDTDKVAIRDVVTGTGRWLTFTNLKAFLKTYFDSVATTLTNKTLTAPAITSPTGIVKADVGLSNVDNTADSAKPVSTAQATANSAVASAAAADATAKAAGAVADAAVSATVVQLAYGLAAAVDLAALAQRRIDDVSAYKTQTGTCTVTQSASNEFTRTYASVAVTLPRAYLNANYQVVVECDSAAPFLGAEGQIQVQSRATNGFILAITGSATSASLRWKTIFPTAQ
jgi:hypothetical protein